MFFLPYMYTMDTYLISIEFADWFLTYDNIFVPDAAVELKCLECDLNKYQLLVFSFRLRLSSILAHHAYMELDDLSSMSAQNWAMPATFQSLYQEIYPQAWANMVVYN